MFFKFFYSLNDSFSGTVTRGKTAVLLDFVLMRGGAAPAFLVNKGVYFLQNANNFNSKLYLGCIYILLNLQIPKSKLGGGGGGGNLDKIQKNSSFSL